MDITFCTYTNLLYFNTVPFTVERISFVVDMMNYGMANQRQFDYSVTIHDKVNGGTVTIDNSNIDEFLQAVADNSRIASDKDFSPLSTVNL